MTLKSSGKDTLDVSWNVPDGRLWNGELTGYKVCFNSRDTAEECLVLQGTRILSQTISDLQPSTKYFVTVSSRTKIGYGNKSLAVSKITNGGNIQFRYFY